MPSTDPYQFDVPKGYNDWDSYYKARDAQLGRTGEGTGTGNQAPGIRVTPATNPNPEYGAAGFLPEMGRAFARGAEALPTALLGKASPTNILPNALVPGSRPTNSPLGQYGEAFLEGAGSAAIPAAAVTAGTLGAGWPLGLAMMASGGISGLAGEAVHQNFPNHPGWQAAAEVGTGLALGGTGGIVKGLTGHTLTNLGIAGGLSTLAEHAGLHLPSLGGMVDPVAAIAGTAALAVGGLAVRGAGRALSSARNLIYPGAGATAAFSVGNPPTPPSYQDQAGVTVPLNSLSPR